MANRGKSSSEIAETLRADICLNRRVEDGMLHEGALGQRFGVSRTPVRQALQRLAYERMITVKSGVGSVISALEENQRDDDTRAAVALLSAVSSCAPRQSATAAQVMDFAGMLGMLEVSDLTQAEDFFELRSRLLTALAALIENPILEDAFRAAYWRLIRWRLRDLKADSAAQVALLDVLVRGIVQTLKDGTIAETFAEVAEIEGLQSNIHSANQ